MCKHTELPTCLYQKKSDLVSKMPDDSSFKAYYYTLNKISITNHKKDIKTCQKHQYNTIQLFRSIFFPHKLHYRTFPFVSYQ